MAKQDAAVVTGAGETSLQRALVEQLSALLEGGQAHAGFDKIVDGMPQELRGERPEQVPYSAWQLLEHLRIAQRDILDFSTNSEGRGYKGRAWPEEYWPKESALSSETAWDEAVAAIRADRESFKALLQAADADLVTPFPWGEGQTLLREALLIADHNAYHLGELLLLRRLLGAWKG